MANDGWRRRLLEDVALSGTPRTELGVLAALPTAVTLLAPDRPPRQWTRSLGKVLLATVQSAGHTIECTEPTRRTLFLPIRGHFLTLTEHGRFVADAGSAVLVPPGERRSRSTAPDDGIFLGVAVTVPTPQEPDHSQLKGQVIGSVWSNPASAALAEYLAFLVRQYARPETPLHRPPAVHAAEALLLDLVAVLDLHYAPIGADQRCLGEERVRQAEALMWARCDEPLTVNDVARAVGVGMRALQLAFRAHRGALPRVVLNRFRLERARARLLTPDPMTTVASVATISGFGHLGRFAAAYYARFGETPSHTLRRSRR